MKEEILGAGVDLFREKGFNAAGVKDITDRAGVPKGSFYNHFESKEVERIRRHFEFLRDGLPDFARGCLFGNFSAEIVDHSETLRMRVKGGFHQWSALLADVIAEGQAAGEIRASLDPQQTARYLMSAWEGTLLQARADKTADAFDIFFAVTFDALLA